MGDWNHSYRPNGRILHSRLQLSLWRQQLICLINASWSTVVGDFFELNYCALDSSTPWKAWGACCCWYDRPDLPNSIKDPGNIFRILTTDFYVVYHVFFPLENANSFYDHVFSGIIIRVLIADGMKRWGTRSAVTTTCRQPFLFHIHHLQYPFFVL